MQRLIITTLLLLFINGCSLNFGRYQQQHDSTPTRLPTKSELNDAIPRAELKSKAGNKSQYRVRGKNYQVLGSAKDFHQTGIASWYGKKFHGHLTSNGEIYNMYGMSAAHKNLPLPTYLKVTNNQNNKSVIVRVNDRGPFHPDRIIDLSYSAAYKLDMLKTGTAPVTISAITDFADKKTIIAINNDTRSPGQYIQVLATKNQQFAQKIATAITQLYQEQVIFPYKNGIYRVQIGPIEDKNHIDKLLSNLRNSNYPNAFKLN